MTNKILGCLALLLIAPLTAMAGNVYVPLATDQVIDGVRYRTQTWVTNENADPRQFVVYFIPSDTDGTDRDEESGEATAVNPGRTLLVPSLVDEGELGMLEISGAPDIVIGARMVATREGVTNLGTAVPVVSSENMYDADDVAHLQGWIRSDDLRSDYGIINLGGDRASCSIAVYRNDGSQILSTVVISVPPLGHRQFDDALGILGEQEISAVRSETSCDQPFYVYLRTYDRATGEVTFTRPGKSLGDSILSVPGAAPPPPACPAGAECIDLLATAYVPRQGEPTRVIDIGLPPAHYKSARLQLDVFHGGWQNPTNGTHNLFWLAVNGNRDLYGYLNFKGPNTNEILFRHGIGMRHVDKPKIQVPFAAVPGQTYHIDYLYDAAGGKIEAVISSGGQELERIVTTPNVNRIRLDPGDVMLISFSYEPGVNFNEPPTYGWRYQNLHLQFFE